MLWDFRTPLPKPPGDLIPFLSFGRHRRQTVRWVIEHDPAYAEWLVRAATTLSPALRGLGSPPVIEVEDCAPPF
jgi:hypothetical protein